MCMLPGGRTGVSLPPSLGMGDEQLGAVKMRRARPDEPTIFMKAQPLRPETVRLSKYPTLQWHGLALCPLAPPAKKGDLILQVQPTMLMKTKEGASRSAAQATMFMKT